MLDVHWVAQRTQLYPFKWTMGHCSPVIQLQDKIISKYGESKFCMLQIPRHVIICPANLLSYIHQIFEKLHSWRATHFIFSGLEVCGTSAEIFDLEAGRDELGQTFTFLKRNRNKEKEDGS